MQTSKVKLAMGISYMELTSFEEAQSLFDQIISEEDPLFMDQALWYKGLSLLKQGELEQAKDIFEQLKSNTDSIFNPDATRLLNRLQ